MIPSMTTLWRIGRFDGDAAAWPALLQHRFPAAAVRPFAAPASALATAASPEVVLVVQHRPREFAPREIDRLIGAHPLARFVCGLGPWCASDGRSQQAWPDGVAVPWFRVPDRLRRAAEVLAGRRLPLPVTASRDETAAFDLDRAGVPPSLPTVAVVSPDRPFAESICEIVADAGGRLVRRDDAAAIVWDADPLGDPAFARLFAFRRFRPCRRIVALTALPTADDARRLRRAGADRVLGKPADLGEMLAALAGDVRNANEAAVSQERS